MRISDWSSDVCSSDLDQATHRGDVMLQARGVVMVEPVKFERQHRERRAQFMRDIGGKIFLAHGGLVKTAEQIVDGVRERQGFGRHMRGIYPKAAFMPARRLDRGWIGRASCRAKGGPYV